MAENRQNLTKDCGSTPEEARKANCVFDLLTTSWVSPACYDHDITLEYLEEGRKRYQGGWYVFHDPSGKRPDNGVWNSSGTTKVELESLAAGDFKGKIWSINVYHQYHCVFSWMKTQKAYFVTAEGARTTRLVDKTISGAHHGTHCRDMIFHPLGGPEAVTGWQEVFYRPCT